MTFFLGNNAFSGEEILKLLLYEALPDVAITSFKLINFLPFRCLDDKYVFVCFFCLLFLRRVVLFGSLP